MKRRTVKKQFWFSRDEAQDLQKKAKKTCLTEAALVRLLVRGYEPKERPDERFYDVMRQLSSIRYSQAPQCGADRRRKSRRLRTRRSEVRCRYHRASEL